MKLTYIEQIQFEINRSKKSGQIERELYYYQALNCSGCASYEGFKGSWSYDGWRKKNKDLINSMIFNARKNSWMLRYVAPVDSLIE